MGRTTFRTKAILAAMATVFAIQPAFADVKAGVDAWTRGEFDKAVKEWRDPAINGDADAQFNLGQAYKMGRGVKTDLNIALDWYKRAAEQGHLQASDSYGHLLHYQGKIAQALPYLQASADRGEPRSQYLLGTELFNGVNIQKDWVRAYALMTRASSSGMAPASRSLAQMDQYIPLEQRQQGTVLAGQLEANANRNRSAQVAGFPINTQPLPQTTRPVSVPPSAPKMVETTAPTPPGFPSNIPVTKTDGSIAYPVAAPITATPKPLNPKPVLSQPVTTSNPDGDWRIQLGAFGNEKNAQNLWNSLENKISGLANLQPYLKSSGSITRLQAGPFSSRAAADAVCNKVKAAGQACISVSK